MGQTNLNLAALIGSRICHDLISPIGAINNGLELMEMSGVRDGPEMQLIAQSCSHANGRIRYFRVAFGAAGEDQEIGEPEIESILDAVHGGGRIRPMWEPRGVCPRAQVRLAFLAMLCLETALPHGGPIRVREERGTWHVETEAESARLDPALARALVSPAAREKVTPAQVQFALLPILAEDQGRTVSLTQGPDIWRLSF